MGMDVEWTKQQLTDFIALHEREPVPDSERTPHGPKTRMVGTLEQRKAMMRTIALIGEALYERAPRSPNGEDARRMLWDLEHGDAVREKLGLDEPGPALPAHDLHPWVWEAARPHWLSGNHEAALWAAAINVNSRLKRKSGCFDIGETKLVSALFSVNDPEPARPRLRRCDRSNPDHFKDMHVGANNLGTGLFMAVRNPINHIGEELALGEREALESLAAWSLFARWVDAATVEVASSE